MLTFNNPTALIYLTMHDDDDGRTPPRIERPPKLPVFNVPPAFTWIPILACVAGSGLLATFLHLAGMNITYEPIPEDELGFGATLLNALIFIGIGAVSAFILIRLIRKRGINALERVMAVAFLILGTFIVFLIFEYMFGLIDQFIPVPGEWSYAGLAGAFAIAASLVYVYNSGKFDQRAHNIVVLVFGVLIGSYLPLVIPTWTALLILVGFSVYDIYSVRHGPIKEMMEHVSSGSEDDEIDLSDFTVDIGIGDLAFYSMLTSLSLISAEWGGPFLVAITGNPYSYIFPFAFTVAGVLLGAAISIQLVKRSKIMPGLPMSIFIGIGLLSLSILIGAVLF